MNMEQLKSTQENKEVTVKNLSPEVKEQLKSESIKNASEALFNMAKEIIEAGRSYDFILSDDASGRLPSLYVKKILDGISEKKGLPKTDIRFVAGGLHGDPKIFEKIGELIKEINPKKVLAVTEFVDSGNSIIKLMKTMESSDIDFDLAMVSGFGNGISNVNKFMFMSEKSNAKIYVGGKDSSGLRFYNKSMSGVKKNKEVSVPFPIKLKTDDFTSSTQKRIQDEINLARKDIDLLAKETLKEFGY